MYKSNGKNISIIARPDPNIVLWIVAIYVSVVSSAFFIL